MTWHWPEFILGPSHSRLRVSWLRPDTRLAVLWVAREKTVMALCSASPRARELNEPRSSTSQALLFSLEYQWESRRNVVYLNVPGRRRQCFGSGTVCWHLSSAVPLGWAGSMEIKYIKSGSLIHCQLYVISDCRQGSYNRRRRGFLHMDFHCVS